MIYVFCVTNRCDVKPVPIETAVRFFRHAPRKKVKSLYLEKKERKPFREPPDISTYSVFAASGVFLAISLPRAQYTRLQPRGQLLCVVAERTRICRMTLVVTSCHSSTAQRVFILVFSGSINDSSSSNGSAATTMLF